MAWIVHDPQFEIKEYDEGWYWRLINEGQGVAQSYGHPNKSDTLEFIRWLKYNGASVPIVGDGFIEL